MRNHFQLQNYYFSTKFCAFNCIIFNAKCLFLNKVDT